MTVAAIVKDTAGDGMFFRTFRQQRQNKFLRSGFSIGSGGRLEPINVTFLLCLFSLTLFRSFLKQDSSSLMHEAWGKLSMKLFSLL